MLELMMQYAREDAREAIEYNNFGYMLDGNLVTGVKFAINFDIDNGVDQDFDSVY